MTGQLLHSISQCDLSSQLLLPNEDVHPIIKSAFDEAITDKILSFGHDGSNGMNASPHLNIERTATMYSTEGGMYIPTTFGVYISLYSIDRSTLDTKGTKDFAI